MLLTAIKFQEAVRVDNREETFLNETNNKVELALDLKTNLVAIKAEKEMVFVPVSNVLWMKKKEEPKA